MGVPRETTRTIESYKGLPGTNYPLAPGRTGRATWAELERTSKYHLVTLPALNRNAHSPIRCSEPRQPRENVYRQGK